MNDQELLKAIIRDFEHMLSAKEKVLVQQYLALVKNQNYELSKKNLSNLEAIINNMLHRQTSNSQAHQAHEQALPKNLFEY